MTATATAPQAPQQKENRRRPVPEWDEAANPWEHPAQYLQARGWRFKGNPHSPHSRWFAPWELGQDGKPRAETQAKEKHQVKDRVWNEDAKKYEDKIVKEFDRVVVTSAPIGVPRDEAVQLQLDKDYEKAA